MIKDLDSLISFIEKFDNAKTHAINCPGFLGIDYQDFEDKELKFQFIRSFNSVLRNYPEIDTSEYIAHCENLLSQCNTGLEDFNTDNLTISDVMMLLTKCIRDERNNDGNLYDMVECGFVQNLLKRLNDLKDQL